MNDRIEYLSAVIENLIVDISGTRAIEEEDKKFALDMTLIQSERLSKEVNNAQALANQAAALAADDDSRIRAMQNGLSGANPELDDLRKELTKFKDAACPLLRTLRMDDTTRINLGYACGFH